MAPAERMLDRWFGATERAAIEAAVKAAEEQTGGEIRVVVLATADDYDEVAWEGAALGALGAAGLAELVLLAGGAWGVATWWVAAPALVGAGVGWLAARLDLVRRALVGTARLTRRVSTRAAELFLSEEVFATRDRSGVLLFLSLFERRVVVLADRGISSRVAAIAWQPIVDAVVEGIHAGRPAAAVVAAVGECGRLLAEHGVERRAEDANELADAVRLGPR
jgi:putative membrane protein